MNIEFEHINDYRIIIPETHQRDGIDFKILIGTQFNIPENNDLILCLIEMVTLRDITAIGETFLYSTLDEDESELYLNNYKEIIGETIDEFKEKLSEFGIVGFKDWYGYNSFILTKTNDVSYQSSINPDWVQSHKHSRHDTKSSEFGKIIETKLEISDIKNFLFHYVQLLEKKLYFSNYPAYCIIVRPISVIKGRTIIPLGNLFLHFATVKEYSQEFYLELINKYLIVWFKNKGVDIIKEVYQKAKKDVEKKVQKNYLPLYNGRAKNRLKNIIKRCNYSLEDCFNKYFDESKESYIEKSKKMALELIPFINEKQTDFRIVLNEMEKTNDFLILSGVDLLKVEFLINDFEDILLRREIFKIGFILLEKEPIEMLNLLKYGYFDNSHHALKWNIWTQMFIPWSKDKYDKKNKKQFVHCITNSFSNIEKELFDYYKSIIHIS